MEPGTVWTRDHHVSQRLLNIRLGKADIPKPRGDLRLCHSTDNLCFQTLQTLLGQMLRMSDPL